MKKIYLLLVVLSISLGSIAQQTIRIFDKVLFYDGYADTSILPQPGPENVLRFSTSLYSTRITSEQIQQLGTALRLNIVVKAACDNYDRIGNVFLAFVPKGATTYDPATAKRLEIARFITPFMNKNIKPDTVPYSFQVDNIAALLRDSGLTDTCDVWMELSIFGVPYAANTQVAGCSGRSDVFYGTVDLVTANTAGARPENTLKVLSNYASFNNYQANATDTLGKTSRTISFEVDEVSYNTSLFLITSNHGANEGGEEYNRRWHYVQLDGEQVLQYRPGFNTCEPYRKYNTQANGIYGNTIRSEATWQSFSNWCPGAIIPIRSVNLGTLQPGTHTFRITVPAAQFVGKQGDIPLTAYVQGYTSPQAVSVTEYSALQESTYLFVDPSGDLLTIESEQEISGYTILSLTGQQLRSGKSDRADISGLSTGVYALSIRFKNGYTINSQFLKP
ncbi:MAG: peptide-N-glycosidase F-related protein [Bacteroidota bacterium]